MSHAYAHRMLTLTPCDPTSVYVLYILRCSYCIRPGVGQLSSQFQANHGQLEGVTTPLVLSSIQVKKIRMLIHIC